VTHGDGNTLWASTLLEELARCGVREVCVAPGSRSTPLVLAASREVGFRARVFLDERSAAFFALGLGKGSGVPAVVITTSGTAVANLLPAVVEASQSEVPLLLLTADRPHHLRDADANQAIRQPGIFGTYTREAWDLPQPRVDGESLLHLRSVAARAVAAALGAPGGPVHLNLPFRKPLEPRPDAGEVPQGFEAANPLAVRGRDGAPLVRIGTRRAAASEEEMEDLGALLDAAERPVLVAGVVPDPERTGPALTRFAAVAGMPLLADPLSGGRTGPGFGSVRVSSYDLFLRAPEVRAALRPDLILRVGAAPTSASLALWLREMSDVPQVVVDGGGRWKDHLNVASRYVQADAADTLAALSRASPRPAPAAWRRRWEAVERAVRESVLDGSGPDHEGHVAAAVVRACRPGDVLFVSSSMPIRDVDAFGGSREGELPVHGNRGASGIDGIVSTAAGVAAAAGRRTVALLGDLALLHDSNGLLAVREDGVELVLVVVNNDGGGIFHMLPIRALDPPFTELFATPHGLDLSHLAGLHGLPHVRIDDIGSVASALEEALEARGSRMIEVRTDRETNRVGHEASVTSALGAARAALDISEE
jgi:2-succinyl-5-enolpyruvyl-6-hydroxy-3-cyclohexene-1-carboxylate synthase